MKLKIVKNSICFFCSSILLMPTVMIAEELETVTAIGYGEDVNGATQSAVESALTQVVGSFIDAENFIKQKTEIQNAVSKTSKTISSSFSSYSQGSVESLSILDVADTGSMKKVTASVTIRIEDFKRYIREVAMGEAKIKGGLFAKAKVKQSQGGNLAELVVDKILAPARNYEAVDIKIGEVSLVEDPGLQRDLAKAGIDFEDKTWVRIPVTVQIKQDFLENAYKILDETSVDRYKGGQIKTIDSREKGYDHEDTFFLLLFADADHGAYRDDFFSHNSSATFSRGGVKGTGYNSHGQARLYALPKSHATALNQRIKDAKIKTGTAPGWIVEAPSVELRMLNSSGETIFEDFLSPSDRQHKRKIQSSSSLIAGEGYQNCWNSGAPESLTILFYKESYNSGENVALIDTESKFDIITALSDDVLEAANSIQVEISY